MISIFQAADDLSQQVTFFWAAAVGRTLNKLEEFCLLVEWLDAAEAAQAAALAARKWVDVDHFDKMVDECKMWLEICAEESAA